MTRFCVTRDVTEREWVNLDAETEADALEIAQLSFYGGDGLDWNNDGIIDVEWFAEAYTVATTDPQIVSEDAELWQYTHS
jgi:hypothetical protein